MSDDKELCVQFAKELEDALKAAILAISDDSLDGLEELVWKQQVLCQELQRQLRSSLQGVLDPSDRSTIYRTFSTLKHVNDTYAVLVQQSGSLANLLLRLCAGYRDSNHDAPRRDTLLFPLEA